MGLAWPLVVFFLLVGGVVAAGVGAVWLWNKVHRYHRAAIEASDQQSYPVCSGCGYRVEGWTGTRCPECGRDREDVGPNTVRPGAWRNELRGLGILVLGMAGLFCGVLALALLVALLG